MDETKVQIGGDVLLDIGTHSDWYISSIGYDGESVDVALRRKADKECKWWLADTPHTEEHQECDSCHFYDDCPFNEREDAPQTYITEDRDTQILDAWQVHHRNTTSVEDEPQTEIKVEPNWVGTSYGRFTHDIRTNTHACVETNADQHTQDVGCIEQTDCPWK